MAQLDFFYPFDSVAGDRKTTAATERRFFNALFTDGVVGNGAFTLTETSAGVYSIGNGVAIIGGAIGGIVNAKTITAKPAQGESLYIALRLDTTNGSRDMQIITTATLANDTVEQLENGGTRDIALYKVDGYGASYGVLDERSYCTSFDNRAYKAEFYAMLDAMRAEGNKELDALAGEFDSIISSADADLSGMFGAAARQGFVNPCFVVNQRGQSRYAMRSGSSYTRDRWMYRIGGSSAYDHVITALQDGKRHALKIDAEELGGTSASAASISQAIEGGVRTFCAGGGKFTVSFDAKASQARKMAVEPTQYTVDASTQTIIKAQTVDLTTDWKRYSIVFEGTETPTEAQLYDVLKIAFFTLWRGYGSRFGADNNASGTVYLANMQINAGDRALPCYVKPYAAELEDCMRYYAVYADTGVSLATGSYKTAQRQVITSPMPLTRKMWRNPVAKVTDRAGLENCASIEGADGKWYAGCTASQSGNYSNSPVWIIDSPVTEVARVNFGSVTLNAEIEY